MRGRDMETQAANTGGQGEQAPHLPDLPLSPQVLHTAGDPRPSCSCSQGPMRVRRGWAQSRPPPGSRGGVRAMGCQLRLSELEHGLAFLCKQRVRPGGRPGISLGLGRHRVDAPSQRIHRTQFVLGTEDFPCAPTPPSTLPPKYTPESP